MIHTVSGTLQILAEHTHLQKTILTLLLLACIWGTASGLTSPYEFVSKPQTAFNRIYFIYNFHENNTINPSSSHNFCGDLYFSSD